MSYLVPPENIINFASDTSNGIHRHSTRSTCRHSWQVYWVEGCYMAHGSWVWFPSRDIPKRW